MGLKTKYSELNFPAFLPDATHASIKGVGIEDVEKTKTQGLVVNTYHAILDGSVNEIFSKGGLHKYIGTKLPIITDSGGFQAMSLIRRSPANGEITEDGIKFHISSDHEVYLTPETCIETQHKLGSDIIMCLDDCTDPSEPMVEQEQSVERTIKWAERCLIEHQKLSKDQDYKPYIFAIIQGGNEKKLRKYCADKLTKIGFDGYAFGGWPINDKKVFMEDILGYTASIMPEGQPKYAMGVGKPIDIKKCVLMGYTMFDCVLPTRDARHKRLYVFLNKEHSDYGFLYMRASKHKFDETPVSEFCDCELCQKHTRSELYNYFRTDILEAGRLATIHNLRFYSQLMQTL